MDLFRFERQMHLPGVAKFAEALEDPAGDLLDAAIRIEAETDLPMPDKANRYGNPEFASASLGPRGIQHTRAQDTKFKFSDAALHSQKQSVIRKRCPTTLQNLTDSGWPFGRPVPRHQFVDAFLRPAIHQACQQVSEIGLWIDAIQLTGLDERCQAGPVFAAFVAARKKAVFSRQTDRPHGALDAVVIEFDASVVEELLQPIPMVQCIPDRLGRWTASRQFRDLRFEPEA